MLRCQFEVDYPDKWKIFQITRQLAIQITKLVLLFTQERSCLSSWGHIPGKSASKTHSISKVLFGPSTNLSSIVPSRYSRILSSVTAWDLDGFWVNLVRWLTAKDTSGHAKNQKFHQQLFLILQQLGILCQRVFTSIKCSHFRASTMRLCQRVFTSIKSSHFRASTMRMSLIDPSNSSCPMCTPKNAATLFSTSNSMYCCLNLLIQWHHSLCHIVSAC